MTTYPAMTVAKWFLAWSEQTAEEGLSNLKLQKLLYYAQGHYLAKFDAPLFGEEIQAWSHGPVVPAIYHEFKGFGGNEITLPEEDDFRWADVDSATTQFLMKVWNTYGGFTAWKLRNMTHDEPPWREHFIVERSATIPAEALRDHFKPRTRVT